MSQNLARGVAFWMLERIGELIQLGLRHSDGVALLAPARDRVLDFTQNLLRALRRNPKARDHRHEAGDRRLWPGRLRNPCLQFPDALRKRVDIECRCKTPLSARFMEETMIEQMIVNIGDQNREGDAPP